MKRSLFVAAVFIMVLFSGSAHALMLLDVNYTGNEVAKAHDTWLTANAWHDVGLGGPISNQFIEYKAFEFTVGSKFNMNTLLVDATAIPYYAVYEEARWGYISRRLSEGATSGQIGLELYGDENNPPTFVGPSQSMTVDFSVISGSVPLRPDLNEGEVQPSGKVLGSASYVFETEDSVNDEIFSTLFIPLSAKLRPNRYYWIAASTPFSGLTLNYSTQFAKATGNVAKLVNPEPSTMVLMGMGLLGMFFRRRRHS
jgi:hypothetical protein